MKYFGIIDPKLIENFNSKTLSDFLIKNKLYEQPSEKIYYFSKDYIDNNTVVVSSNYRLNEEKYSTNFIGTAQVFSLTLFELMKFISAEIKKQFKNDLNQYLNIKIKSKFNLNNLLISEVENIKLEPTQILLEDFYESLIKKYLIKIDDEKCKFFIVFNEEIYGLNFNEQRKIALKNYKEIYSTLFKDKITYMPDDDYESYDFEDELMKIENKLKIVYYNKLKYQHKLATINQFFEYLTGDKSIFSKQNFKKHELIFLDIIKYEASKSIMIQLNNEYKFEEDFYFTNSLDDKKKYKKYDDLFTSFNAFMFTNVEIKKYHENVKSNIESLYEFLRVNNLINKGKNKFISYLKNEHNIHLTKIIAYINYDNREDFPEGGKKPNDEHEKRVKIITEKWSNFT